MSNFDKTEWDKLAKKYKVLPLYIDYRYRDLQKSDAKTFVWDVLSLADATATTEKGVLIKEKVENIIGLRVSTIAEYASYKAEFAQTITHDAPYMMEIKEFNGQGMNSPLGNYQFSFIGNTINLIPKNNGVIWFDSIVKQLPDTLSIRFYKPQGLVYFPTPFARLNNMVFGYPTEIGLTYQSSNVPFPSIGDRVTLFDIHILFGGDEVDFEIRDSLMNYEGIVISNMSPDKLTIYLDIDTSAATGAIPKNTGIVIMTNPKLSFNIDVMYDNKI